jgi:acetylglutamate kinase
MSADRTVNVVKVGGNIIDDEARLDAFLSDFSTLPGAKLLVHGGGKLATRMASDLGIPQTMVDGRRITDAATLRIVTMVYAGLVNKGIVAGLQARRCPAIGLCGADADIVRAHRRTHPTLDYGFVGDVDNVDGARLSRWLDEGLAIVLAPITHDGQGTLLNTNADTIAQEAARALAAFRPTQLAYCFEKPGVLLDASDDSTRIPHLDPDSYRRLREEGRIFAGMIPKLDNAFDALRSGVRKVSIGQAESLRQLLAAEAGTTLTLEPS